jgi:hypothetical protein
LLVVTWTGSEVRVPAKKLLAKLREPAVSQVLSSALTVTSLDYRCRPSNEELEELLKVAPKGQPLVSFSRHMFSFTASNHQFKAVP